MNNLPKVVAQQRRGRASNPRLIDRKSDALPLSHRATPSCTVPLQKSPDGYRWCSMPPLGLVVGTGKYDHIMSALRDVLHWLPVPQRTEFKIAVLAFDCVRSTGPAYFKDVCVPVLNIAARSSLRSAERGDLFIEQERRSSVDGVSRWLLRSSGITTSSLTITTDKSRTVSGWA